MTRRRYVCPRCNREAWAVHAHQALEHARDELVAATLEHTGV